MTARASATSSITASRNAAGAPARSSTERRTSTQPPAHAAVRAPGRFTRRNGYNCAKKYTNAGTTSRSHPVSTRSRAIRDTRSSPEPSAADTSAASDPGPCAMSASVSSTYSPSARPTPCRTAHSLPVHPGSGSPGETTSSGSPAPPPGSRASRRASAPVPSSLLSSTSTTRAGPGYRWASSEGRLTGSVPASFRAGTTTVTDGHRVGAAERGGAGRGRQNSPWNRVSHTQDSSDATASALVKVTRRSVLARARACPRDRPPGRRASPVRAKGRTGHRLGLPG
ncbi:hypothetical protein GCM10027168_54330 [Streptomyces capparidis]